MSGTVRCRAGSRDAAGRPGTNRKSVWSMQISWVTLDRLCQQQAGADPVIGRMLTRSGRPLRSNAEQLTDADLLDKLRSFGIDLDREGLSKLCEGALSAEEVACELLDSHGLGDDVEEDWIWISLVTLWQRWWPDRVCLEFLDDKVQAGYDVGQGHDLGAALAVDPPVPARCRGGVGELAAPVGDPVHALVAAGPNTCG